LVILYSRGKGKELKDAEQGCIADTLTFVGSETASAGAKTGSRQSLSSPKIGK